MANYEAPDAEWFKKHKLTPPETTAHGTEEEIQDRMVEMKPKRWRQEANKLIGQTELGEVVNFIPTDMMLTGTDKDGLPILKKIV